MLGDKSSQLATRVTSGLLLVIAAVHVYWAAGGNWALKTIANDSGLKVDSAFRVFCALIAVAAVALALVLPRWRTQTGRVHKAEWVIVAILAVGGVARAGAAPIIGITALLVAALIAISMQTRKTSPASRRRCSGSTRWPTSQARSSSTVPLRRCSTSSPTSATSRATTHTWLWPNRSRAARSERERGFTPS